MAPKKKNHQYDANDLIVDQNNQYNKILSEDFTLGLLNIYLNLLKHGKKDISSIKQYVLD